MNVDVMTVVKTDACSCSAMRRLERVSRERDALATRVRILEAVLAGIEREADVALEEPDVAFLVSRRVSTLARQTL